ncbi:MAG: methyltransferase domain-containing protein [Bryobacteraceae bacterium]
MITACHDRLHTREADFHDDWAASTPLDQILVHECFEAPTAVENRFVLSKMGPLHNIELLDIGSGLGESSVYFALHGARVTAVDVSPGMVDTTVRLGQQHGVTIHGKVAVGEDLCLPPDHFDLVYLANTIHHVHDRDRLFQQIHNTLKPGGRFFSIDPIAYNPLINIYRKMATQTRTEDESPLTYQDIATARHYFTDVGHREFWLASLALFVKYYLVDRVHPNDDRYWKRILRETKDTLWWWLPLSRLDRLLTRLPYVRYLCWNTVLWGTKADAAAGRASH